jgi:hypothetical protein
LFEVLGALHVGAPTTEVVGGGFIVVAIGWLRAIGTSVVTYAVRPAIVPSLDLIVSVGQGWLWLLHR